MDRGMAPSHAIANGTGKHGNPFRTLRDQDDDHAPATAAVQTHWLVGAEPSAPSSGRLSSVLEDTASTEVAEVERLRTELEACRMLLLLMFMGVGKGLHLHDLQMRPRIRRKIACGSTRA